MSFSTPEAPPAPVPPPAPAPPPMFGEGKVAQRKARKPGQRDSSMASFLGGMSNPTNTGTATLLGG